jgi:hypothetical protein
MNFKDIRNFIEGNYNHLLDRFNSLDDKTKAMAQARISICKTCPNLKDNKCNICKCAFPSLTFSESKSCPDNKW